MIDEKNLKEFTVSFFSQLGAKLTWIGDNLEVSGIPQTFENLYGKKCPYLISFSHSSETEDFVAKGSTLLQTMTSYLDQKGQAALIKIDFDSSFRSDLPKILNLRNSEISSISLKSQYKLIYRFNFATTLQYLNEKESVTNSIYVADGKIVSFNLDNHFTKEGNPEEVPNVNIRSEYELAKSHLKSLVDSRVKESQVSLGQRLDREIERLNEHYANQRNERQIQINRFKEQLANAEKNPEAPEQKKQRLIESIKSYEDPSFFARLENERNFFIKDEEHKHSLNVNNKLISTTVIYYPIFTATIFLKNLETTRQLVLVYDPLAKSLLTSLVCECCAGSMPEIFLCSSSHLICNNCGTLCKSCNRIICTKCSVKMCDSCMRKLCKRCTQKCSLCWKDVCKMHSQENYLTGKNACLRCVARCQSCGLYADKKQMQKASSGDCCPKCSRLQSVRKSFTRL